MKADIQTDDKKFLEQALRFYRNIDKHSSLLELNLEDVEVFKNDIKIFLFVSDKRYRSFTESFVRYNISIMRIRLEQLFAACTVSKNYTNRIGEELGVITLQYKVSWPEGWGHISISPYWGISSGL